MGRTAKAALMALLCGWGASAAGAQAPGGWVGGAPYQTRVVVGADGSTYVGIWVQAPQMPVARARAPMAVSLVIDTSGSMAGDKIENARMAASSLLETLSDGDVVSLYAFSDGVVELAPPTVLSAASRGLMMQRVRALAAMGGTNMWDGMQIAVRRMSEAPPSHPLRRVFLISDGRANVGPSDPASLGALAARATEWGTQVTAIGVGTDYDQTTLTAMAVQSAGRLYHLGQPYEMASILQNELQLLSRSVALNAYLEVEPAPGVLILEGLTMGTTLDHGRLRMPLGAVFAGQQREVLLRARVDTARLGSRPLATARLVYQTPGEQAAQQTQSATLAYEVVRDASAAAQSSAPRVVAMVADFEATQTQREAAAMLARGENARAAQVLQAGQHRLQVQAAAAPPAAAARMSTRAQALGQASQQAGAATTAAEQRARSYEFEDSAVEASGY